MARKKKKKKGGLKSFFSKKKKSKRSKRKDSDSFVTGLKVALSIMFLTILVAGGAIGLIYMDRYVSSSAQGENGERLEGSLKLIDYPAWLNQDWIDTLVATAGGKRFPLDQGWAQTVATRLATLSWLDNVQVQTTPEYLTVKADYRRPVGLVQLGRKKGLASTKVPKPGQTWLADDAAAAVELLDLLYMADLHFQQEKGSDPASSPDKKIPEKPLLNEIESIDVSNVAARKSRSAPNIILNVTDGTKVYWGAAWGQANIYFEADEKDKLARLYQFFMDHSNTLGGAAKYIELRWPQDSIPRPR
ncbi:MAG: hypothetical protein ACYSPI_06710 [Planctomycetota bacterium]|jgi:hypothetical protein